MKMQELIAKLREEAPFLEKRFKDVDDAFHGMWRLLDDFRRAESAEGRQVLADAVCNEANVLGAEYLQLQDSVEAICRMNREYREKLGPRKPKDAPGQQMLPGMEEVANG